MSPVVHRSSDLLQRFVAGELDEASRAAVVAELATCAECRAVVGALARGERATHRERRPIEVPPTQVPDARSGWIGTGKRIGGRYKVERVLGEGGMGVVYQVLHELLNRRFALKMLHPERSTHAGAVRRFLGEARMLASLGHEGIVDVVDLGHDDDESPFLVMEMLEGESLEQRLSQRGRMPLEQAFDVALRVADALGAAHAGGVIHRDVKPANVFLGLDPQRAGWVKLLDFGLAKLRSAEEDAAHEPTLTRTGAIMGTPRYMAPEQWAADKDIDARADVFSWAVTVHRMLTGELPYRRDGIDLLPGSAERPDVRRLRPEVPLALSELIEGSLALDRALRPLDGNVLSARWREAVAQFATKRPESVRPRASRAPVEDRARSSDLVQPVIGRVHEIEALLGRVDARERALVVVGPEGVGKSALLGAVAAVIQQRPHPLHGPTRLLRAEGTSPGPFGPLAPLVSRDALASSSDGHARAEALERALRERLFGTGALDVVLLIGDPSALDPDSVRLVSELGASVGAFVLGEARSVEAAESIGAEIHSLGGLNRDDLGALAASCGVILDGPGLDALAVHTGGHPLFALQCLALQQERGRDVDSIPAQLEDAIAARLEAAPPEAAHAWQVAAILRAPITLGDLLALGATEGASGIAWLTHRGILEPIDASGAASGLDVALRFTAGLLADVAERALVPTDRANLHRGAAALRTKQLGIEGAAIRGRAAWARIARHHELGGDAMRASDALARAALGTAAVASTDEPSGTNGLAEISGVEDVVFSLRARWARDALRLAHALGRARKDGVELELVCIEGLEGEGRYQDALAALSALEASPWTADQEARALVRQGSYEQRLGRHEAALHSFARAEVRARAGGVLDTWVISQGKHAVCLALARRLEDARDLLLAVEERVLTSSGGATGEPALPNARRADLAGWKAQIAGLSGDLGERRDAYWAAVELFRAEGNHRFAAFSLLNLGDTYSRLGAYDEAERALERAQRECLLLGARTMAGYAALNLGYALMRLDRPEEARAKMDEAHAVAQESGDRRLSAFTALYRARLVLEHETSEPEVLDALRGELTDGTERDPSFRAVGLAMLSRATLSRAGDGSVAEALAQARAAEDIVLEVGALEEGEADVALALADALLASGQGEEAQRVVRRAARRVQEVARKIAGAHWRARFTVDVPAHRILLERAQT